MIRIAPPPAARIPASEPAETVAARGKLTQAATEAVSTAVAAQQPDHPVLEKFGEGVGMALGVVVTELLALKKSWNAPVLDAAGKQVNSVPGATRIGNHPILERHQEVAGPMIARLVAKLSPGAVHDLLDGVAKGGTAAPGTSYRLESHLKDLFTP